MNEPFKDTSDFTNSTPVATKKSPTVVDDKSKESKKDQFKCEKCDFRCKKEGTLTTHINTKHAAQQCKICSQTLVSAIELLQHITKEHNSNEETNINISES